MLTLATSSVDACRGLGRKKFGGFFGRWEFFFFFRDGCLKGGCYPGVMEVKWCLISPRYPTHASKHYDPRLQDQCVRDLHPRYARFLSTCFFEGELMIVSRCTRGTSTDGSRVYVVDTGSQVQKDLEDYFHSEQAIRILHLGWHLP